MGRRERRSSAIDGAARPAQVVPLAQLRALADQAFSRAAGAPLVPGNRVRLLQDAGENYPAWLEAIASARRSRPLRELHHPRGRGRATFATPSSPRRGRACACGSSTTGWAASARRRAASGGRLREAGVEVRCYNPPRFDAPLGWLSPRPPEDARRGRPKSASSPGCASGRCGSAIPSSGHRAVARHGGGGASGRPSRTSSGPSREIWARLRAAAAGGGAIRRWTDPNRPAT